MVKLRGMTRYISTRGQGAPQAFADILLEGLAPDGGLYVPEKWPEIDWSARTGQNYAKTALGVMTPFLGGSIAAADFAEIVQKTYAPVGFRHPACAPLVEIGPDLWILELFHGPTIAFKDYALQLLGALFDHVLTARGQRITVVGATSGDTGSAAIEACRHCKNVDIFILHPRGRVSEVQRRQMTTVAAENVHNIALDGNFDDCQAMVKAMFADEAFRRAMNLSAINSINWARIAAQTVYYAAACAALGGGAGGRKISFAVPTGNFGNVYAAYAARRCGLPVDRLVIGTNRNDIITRFFETGSMRAETVTPTLSPSMDIQISSNFERYLFELLDRDAAALRGHMQDFREKGEFSVSKDLLERARGDFAARRCDEEETLAEIGRTWRESGYLIDPHTAVGLYAARAESDRTGSPLVALACAHPAKFPDAVEKATGLRPPLPPHLADLFGRREHVDELPNDLAKVQDFIRRNGKPI